jgi:hypothetical protein
MVFGGFLLTDQKISAKTGCQEDCEIQKGSCLDSAENEKGLCSLDCDAQTENEYTYCLQNVCYLYPYFCSPQDEGYCRGIAEINTSYCKGTCDSNYSFEVSFCNTSYQSCIESCPH